MPPVKGGFLFLKEIWMIVTRSHVMGYCSGVSQVIEKAWETLALAKKKNQQAYSIGWFIHNPNVVKQFEDEGMKHIDSPEQGAAGVALIRAHGLSDPLRDEFEKKGFTLIDGTCPTVAYSQALIRKSTKDQKIVIVGQRYHSEVTALSNVWDENKSVIPVTVVENEEDVKALPLFDGFEILLMTQTTFAQMEYEKLKELIKEKYKERLKIGNKLCPTTYRRHEALIKLCKEVDAVIVVGGKMSSNTTALTEIVNKENLPVWHIESASEIPKEIYNYERVGVAAGTSTPPSDINEVVATLELSQH